MVQSSMGHPQEQKTGSIAMEYAMRRDRTLVPSSLVTFYLAVTGMAYLLVSMTNGFIIVVNLSDWSKGRGLMSNDKILSSLMLSNLCYSTSLTAEYFLSLILDEFYSVLYHLQRVFMTLDIATSFLSFWFTAWLSVFYCVKIVSFKRPLLLKMKLQFPALVRWLLLGSTVASLGAALLFQWAFMLVPHRRLATGSTNRTAGLSPASNCTCNHVNARTIVVHMCPVYRVLVIILGCSVPLVVVVFSLVPVLCSLFRHTQKLEQTLSPSHLEAHVKAAKAVLSFLLCYIVLFACETLVRAEIYRNWYYQYFLCMMVQLATLLVQSTILIRKLRF
ncbi:UNVERIFIED_CONTAM: hypothetical protein K2H54_025739 [Gekko kuhli]